MSFQVESLPIAEAEVVGLCRELIQIDTVNDGTRETVGEARAAEFVEHRLREVGYDPERFSTDDSHRQGVYLHIPGSDPTRGALLLHGHLDVVPAMQADWSVPAFGAEVIDDMIWGRGAVDMKDMDAMILAVVRHWAREGITPPRDIVVLFLPDEEAGGRHGAHWLVEHRPEFFEGVTEAVGEVGGFSFTVRDDLRLYLIQTAEKGIAWMRLRANGTAGHGSVINPDNAVTTLARAVTRIGEHEWPIVLRPSVRQLIEDVQVATGLEFDPTDREAVMRHLGPVARFVGATMSHTANPTMLDAGYKANVIPGHASASIDGRFIPGEEDSFFATIDELLGPDVIREFENHDIALETTFDGPTIDAMAAALKAEDPYAHAVPYMLSGGTDAKSFATLGVRCYGFAPLLLPPELDFGAMFHGVDERVPLSALTFGVRVLNRFLLSC